MAIVDLRYGLSCCGSLCSVSYTFIFFSPTVLWIVLIGKPNMKMIIIGIQKIWRPQMIIIQMLTILKEPLLKSVPFQIWIFFWIRKSIAMTQRCDLPVFQIPSLWIYELLRKNKFLVSTIQNLRIYFFLRFKRLQFNFE